MADLSTKQLLGIINSEGTQDDSPYNRGLLQDIEEDQAEGEFAQDELDQARKTVNEVERMVKTDSISYQEVFENI